MQSDITTVAMTVAEELVLSARAGDDSIDTKAQKSKTDRLVELAECCEFFRQDVDEPFATFNVGDHTETWPIKSSGFRRWLSHEFWKQYKSVPGSQAMQDAENVLSGRANYDGKQVLVHTRVAEHGGNLYLDLADNAWRVVEITANGWSIISDAPVKFIRARGMQEIPAPSHHGDLNLLRNYINVGNEEDFALIKAFLIATLRPGFSFPFKVFTGEQGSGKTSQSRKLKSLVDPGKAAVRGLRGGLRDLAIAAGNSWLMALDNVSTIPTWTSDALCSLSTGGGFATRELYSNDDEKIFDYQRPVILNGIGDIVTRPDLLDRCIVLELPIIPEDERRQESELNRQFEIARPLILGGLLDAAVMALHEQSKVKLARLPRMADFATWAVAAEPAHSQEAVFMNAYTGNRVNLNQVALDSSIIGPAILELLNNQDRWDGQLGELLDRLNENAPDSVRKSRFWPSIPRLLKSELARLAPNLRKIGVTVTLGRRNKKGAVIILERIGNASSPSSPSTPPGVINDLEDGRDRSSDDGGRASDTYQRPSAPGGISNPLYSGGDADGADGDDVLQHQSSEEFDI